MKRNNGTEFERGCREPLGFDVFVSSGGRRLQSEAPPLRSADAPGGPQPTRLGRPLLRLSSAFIALLAVLVGVGWLGPVMIGKSTADLGKTMREKWNMVQLSRQALRYSSLNNRLTMGIFLVKDKKAIADMLAERARNSDKITALIQQIEAAAQTDLERELLANIRAARAPYVESYKIALRRLLEEGNADEGRFIMFDSTLPKLVLYHSRWEAFSELEGRQLEMGGHLAQAKLLDARRLAGGLMGGAMLLLIMIGWASIRGLAKEMRTRQQAESDLRKAGEELEERVAQRTRELAEVNEELASSAVSLGATHARLQKSEELHRTLVYACPDAILVTDLAAVVQYASPATVKVFGQSCPEEMTGRQLQDWIAPEDQVKTETNIRYIVAEGRPRQTDYRLMKKDTSCFYAEVHAAVVRSGDNVPTGIVFMIRDVSDRKLTEAALRERQAKLDSILQTAPVGIGVVLNRVLQEVNQAMCGITGYSQEELVGQSTRQLYLNQEDFEELDRERRRQMKERSTCTVESKWRTKNGQVRNVLIRASPISWEEAGLGVNFIVLDITDHKRSELQVEKLHKELLLASRQAGMAEVATSVLHNVGNVLNSINVSTTLVAEKLKSSGVENVAQIGSLLDAHTGDLAGFFTSHAAGRQLPAYINRLAKRLTDEQTYLLKEIGGIQTDVHHIKDIVGMQQSYAKVFGVVEKVKVTDLVEDALRMNAGALVRHDVEVVREYALEIPEVVVEKHKVLQILVNLIRNAKYACDESGRADKRLTLCLARVDNTVRIAVIDNGVGIPAVNMDRIFNHGFTTRKNGHGFGLHSAALTASEMGGKLSVHSAGPQRGATFTLEIPLHPPKSTHE